MSAILQNIKTRLNNFPDFASKPSLLLIVFTVCFSFWFVDLWRPYNQAKGEHNFYWDVFGYYSYLPAYFCNNGSMEIPGPLADYNPPGPLGTHVPKYTCGVAIMQLPFFLLAYKIAHNQGSPLDGFSEPFVTCIHWSAIVYVIIGLFFLRALLLNYFSERVTAITLAAVFFGSMLFHYTYVQGEMTHSYLFSLFSAFLWMTDRWHRKQSWTSTFWAGFIIGLIALIRPTEVYVFFFFLLWNVKSANSLVDKLRFFKINFTHLLLIGFVAAACWIPQLLFYKKHAGSYFYFSYMRERFFWTDPQIINVLFSYRKGWLMYTPVVALSFLGFFCIDRKFPLNGWTFFGLTLLILYVLSCWWDWNYGGCFGARSFCQHIAVLSVPMASVIEKTTSLNWKPFLKGITNLALFVFIFSCICLNIGMTYQYNLKKIHPWAMSGPVYWEIYRKYQFSDKDNENWWRYLDEPDFLKYSDGSDRSR